ncbi:hypothetical protein chiPu_0020270 [Chiloscyllium punctatum]|uniref:Uncharacterized protein n=1 Tax=Chiloscyllium punctatum TaxID=137246 RepID=A0A401RUH1_CHIPU|nr:hypothetical protein [Chiloscyllium punctatum]
MEGKDAEAIKSLALHLRELGDLINREHLDSFTTEFQKLAAQQATDQVCMLFSNTVDQICQERFNGLAVEQNLLKVTASLGKQIVAEKPDLFEMIKASMQSFMTTRLGSWVAARKGWKNVNIE